MIVLLHSASYAPGTVEAMPWIIEYFQENGYRFGSLTEKVCSAKLVGAQPLKGLYFFGKQCYNRYIALLKN